MGYPTYSGKARIMQICQEDGLVLLGKLCHVQVKVFFVSFVGYELKLRPKPRLRGQKTLDA
jgi:hypothetical protein